MANGKLEWVEIPAPDVEGSASFYESVFGWKLKRDGQFEGYLMFEDGGGAMGGAFTAQHQVADQPGVLLYITVDSIDRTLARVEEKGGTALEPRTLITEEIGWWGTFRDPAGNVIGVFESPAG